MNPILVDFQMPIISPRLLLRPPLIEDVTVLHEAMTESFDNIRQTIPWTKNKPSLAECEIFVRQAAANWILKKNEEPYLPIFIFDINDNSFIGSTSFHHMTWEVPSLEIGYWLRNKCINNGFMTEAVNALTQYAVKQLKMRRITITCGVENTKSRRIAETLGYVLEATFKSHRINPAGKVSDTLVFVRYDLIGIPPLVVSWGNEQIK